MGLTRLHHDPLCPSCGEDSCEACKCLCDFIADIRDDERQALARVAPWVAP